MLCHGDLHGENLLVRNGDVVAVLDWELAQFGPPELDVARTALILSTLPGIGAIPSRLLAPMGRRSARAFVAAYARRRAVDSRTLEWYDVLHAARALAVSREQSRVGNQWRPLQSRLQRRIARRIGRST